MNTSLHGALVVTAVVSLSLGLGACGQAGQSTGKDGASIGVLLPENQTPRYEQFDRPLIEKKIKELCGRCTVEYANALDDEGTQRQQINAMINKGIDVLILDAVDIRGLRSSVAEAQDADIPVVAYDRLVEGPISAYVSHDLAAVGRLQGEALLKALGGKQHSGLIVRVEGPSKSSRQPSPFTQGAQPVLEGRVKISKMYRAESWNAGSAYAAMSDAIAAEGADTIDGVWAGNDVLASGVIAALKSARITPLPPVVGQDADLPAVQRIVSGEQYMTVYKPYKPEADAAAEIAVALGRGEEIDRFAKSTIDTPT